MRRMLLLACAVAVLASVAVVALASSPPAGRTTGPKVATDAEPSAPAGGPFALAARQGASDGPTEAGTERHRAALAARDRRAGGRFGTQPGGRHAVVREVVVRDLGERLGVDRRTMEYAIDGMRAGALAHAVDTGLISVEQRLVLEGCMDGRDCDRAAARRAMRDLRAGLTPRAREEYKTAMLKRLAWGVGREVEEVEISVRTELETKLGFARRVGWVSERGAATALACFDRPGACDVRALRRELHRPFHDRRRGR